MIISRQKEIMDLQTKHERLSKMMNDSQSEMLSRLGGGKNKLQSSAQGTSKTNAPADNSGVHMTLSKDALKELNEKSTAEYNKIVKDASSKSGALSEDVMNRFKTNTLSQAKTSMLAQANSSPQSILALLS